MKRKIARKIAKAEKKPRKKGVNPRTKGKSLEYRVRDILAAWTGKEFSRTPSSGAFGTTNKMHELVGDIVCKNADFGYSVECKNTEGWHLEGLLNSEKGPIPKWWKQTVEQANASKKVPLLVFTKNHYPMYCMSTIEGLPKAFPGRVFCLQIPDDENFLYIFLLSDLIKTPAQDWIK